MTEKKRKILWSEVLPGEKVTKEDVRAYLADLIKDESDWVRRRTEEEWDWLQSLTCEAALPYRGTSQYRHCTGATALGEQFCYMHGGKKKGMRPCPSLTARFIERAEAHEAAARRLRDQAKSAETDTGL